MIDATVTDLEDVASIPIVAVSLELTSVIDFVVVLLFVIAHTVPPSTLIVPPLLFVIAANVPALYK